MIRIMFGVFMLVSMMWLPAAMAQQPTATSDCDRWIATIHAEADDIAQMCKDGKMAEAQKTAIDMMALLGIKQQ